MTIRPLIGLILVLLFIAVPIFSHIDDIPLQIWDESRLANNAVEMYEGGNILIPTYDHQPDMWNTKPPLMIWLQVLSLKVLGLNDIAVRLPSILAALLTCLFLYWFFARKYKVPIIGIFSCLVLTTSTGYIAIHGTRTGDYDSLLTFFTTLYTFYFFLFLEEDNRKYLLLSILFITLATLTKGIAGLLFLPAILIYTIYKKKLSYTLRSPQLYIGMVTFLLLVPGYYLLREQYNPGYIDAVAQNELGGRFNNALEDHGGDVLYYFHQLVEKRFHAWYVLAIASMIFGFFSKDRLFRDISIFTSIFSLSFLLILSISATKISWYLLPLYPLWAANIACLLYTLCHALYHSTFWQPYLKRNILPVVLILFVFAQPYSDIIKHVTFTKAIDDGPARLARTLKNTIKDKYPYDHDLKVVFTSYHSELDWYLKIARLKNMPVNRAEKNELKDEDLVSVYDTISKKFIEENYIAHIVSADKGITIYQVHGRKE